jgi:uroporphyrinogen decarboxylase
VFGTDAYYDCGVDLGPAPPFAHEVVSEDDTTRTYINHEGILMREFKAHSDTSMPQFLRFPVETAADFETLVEERLAPAPEHRLTDAWRQAMAAASASGLPRRCWYGRWGGFFGPLRNLMGLENLCVAFYEQPALVQRMMEQRADVMIAVTEAILAHTEIDTFWFWEDMAYNHGSLIDPRMFRRFALPQYRRVVDFVRSRGVRHIGLDSDGDITELIPLWLDAGITFLWPFEVAAGMDVVEVRKRHGHSLAIGGGIPKQAVALGGEEMRRAVDRVMPLVEDGGYIPELDHGAPPDISWTHFREYMEYLMLRLGRG